jgi:hypothetical protein
MSKRLTGKEGEWVPTVVHGARTGGVPPVGFEAVVDLIPADFEIIAGRLAPKVMRFWIGSRTIGRPA